MTCCDHACEAHTPESSQTQPRVRIIGAVPPYQPTPEVEAAYAEARQMISEIREAARARLDKQRARTENALSGGSATSPGRRTP